MLFILVFPVAMVVSMSMFCMLIKSVSVLDRSTTVSLVSRLVRREVGKVDSLKPARERLVIAEGAWTMVVSKCSNCVLDRLVHCRSALARRGTDLLRREGDTLAKEETEANLM